MVEFDTYDDVARWARVHGVDALRELLSRETMRSNSQSLADIWLQRHGQGRFGFAEHAHHTAAAEGVRAS